MPTTTQMSPAPQGPMFPAVQINGRIYVATYPGSKREPTRHYDALTKAIRVIAQSNLQDPQAQQLMKQIDMGHVTAIFGSAFADGSSFVALT